MLARVWVATGVGITYKYEHIQDHASVRDSEEQVPVKPPRGVDSRLDSGLVRVSCGMYPSVAARAHACLDSGPARMSCVSVCRRTHARLLGFRPRSRVLCLRLSPHARTSAWIPGPLACLVSPFVAARTHAGLDSSPARSRVSWDVSARLEVWMSVLVQAWDLACVCECQVLDPSSASTR